MVRPRPLVTPRRLARRSPAGRSSPSPSRRPAAPAADTAGNKPSAAARKKKEKPTPIEERPYKIRAWVSVAPKARLDYRGREALIAGWKTLIERFVGPPWQVEVADGDGPLLTERLDDLMPEAVAPLAQGFDKAWVIQARPLPDGYGVSLSGREWDAATGQIGLIGTRPARSIEDAPRALLELALDIFAPTAEIGKKVGGGVMIQVQGSLLPGRPSRRPRRQGRLRLQGRPRRLQAGWRGRPDRHHPPHLPPRRPDRGHLGLL